MQAISVAVLSIDALLEGKAITIATVLIGYNSF
jgi:hypothetical protein